MLYNIALLALAGAASAIDFSGNGQIRALASATQGNGTDLGCLTDAGAWTIHDDACGNFTGTRTSGSVYVTLSSLNGPCTLSSSNFTCSSDLTALKFWAWSGLLDDHDVLAYGEQITYSSSVNISESTNATVPIRTYRTTDNKPWIWLTWTSI